MSRFPRQWLAEAQQRLAPHIRQTPLEYDSKHNIYIKWENVQRTGSFKIRGALNKILSLDDWELEKGVVAASAGNHGQGVALAARMRKVKAIIVASNHAVPSKLDAMRQLGAEIHLVDGGYELAEAEGIQLAEQTGAVWVSPYNDSMVIAGQGTIGLEIADQLGTTRLADIRVIVMPIGGGGLAAGMGAAFEGLSGSIQLIGAQPEASPFFHAILTNGSQEGVVETESLADGLSGAVQEGAITIPLVKSYLTGITLVSEAEIEQAIAYAWYAHGQTIEGSAAAALAALLSGKVAHRPAVVVLTGGNIQSDTHTEICQRWTKRSSQW